MSNYLRDKAKEEARIDAHNFLFGCLFGSEIVNICYTGDYDFELDDGTTVELKNDERCKDTGNIAIELFGNKGQPSGLNTTRADYWLVTARISESQANVYLFKKSRLKQLIKGKRHGRSREGASFALLAIDEIPSRNLRGQLLLSNNKVMGLTVYPLEELVF